MSICESELKNLEKLIEKKAGISSDKVIGRDIVESVLQQNGFKNCSTAEDSLDIWRNSRGTSIECEKEMILDTVLDVGIDGKLSLICGVPGLVLLLPFHEKESSREARETVKEVKEKCISSFFEKRGVQRIGTINLDFKVSVGTINWVKRV